MTEPQTLSGRIPLFRAAAAAVAVLLVAALTVYAALLTRENEIRSARSDFESVAEHIIVGLRRELERCTDVVRLTAAIFNGSNRISRENFAVYARGALSGREGLLALAFVPRVRSDQRADFESSGRDAEVPGFAFTQKDPAGAFIPAAPSPEHYPVLYVEPRLSNESALGFDLSSDTPRRAALMQAKETGDLTATARVKPILGPQDSWAVLVLDPIFPGDVLAVTPEQREQNLKGFALGVIELNTLLRFAMQDVASEQVRVELDDTSAPPGERTLFVRDLPSPPQGSALSGALSAPAMKIGHSLVVGQRKWELDCASTPQFFASRLSWRPVLVLGCGLAITLLLGMYMFQSLRLLALSEIHAAERRLAEIQLTDKVRRTAKAEREARDGEKKLQTILSGIKAATLTIDARTFTILDMNHVAERLFRVCGRNWIGKPQAELLGRNLRPLDLSNGAVRGGAGDVGASAGGEFVLNLPDGKLVPLSRTVLSTSDSGGQYIFEVLFDISEKKALERQLGLSQKLESVGQLASGIAHEINTPIQYIGGNLGFLKEAFEGVLDILARFEALVGRARAGEPLEGAMDEIARAKEKIHFDALLAEIPGSITDSISGAERVAGIVGAMKKFSHPDAGGRRLVDVNKALEATLTISRNEWKYDSEMRTELDPDLPYVNCSPGDFNQVLLNVVVNAAHAVSEKFHGSGAKGLITVKTAHEDGTVAISVSDTGVGIPRENLDRIFDPFFTTKEVGKGTGQGLAIVHSIVEKHDGSIEIESVPGEGTTFTIRLPAGQEGHA